MIHLILSGRLGNQLFMYAAAEQLRLRRSRNETICIHDIDILRSGWMTDLLPEYALPGVEFDHADYTDQIKKINLQSILLRGYLDFILPKPYQTKYRLEKKYRKLFQRNGLLLCQNGFLPTDELPDAKDVVMLGYFQSEQYFPDLRDKLIESLVLRERLEEHGYPLLDELPDRNTVCVTLKVESNVGNKAYGVCTEEYWRKGIRYMKEHTENPLFFVCSDNVDYAKGLLSPIIGNDVIFQPRGFDAVDTLSAMALCNHYVISNSSFSWWAQYLGSAPEKIVAAPSRWMAVDMPLAIEQDNWVKL